MVTNVLRITVVKINDESLANLALLSILSELGTGGHSQKAQPVATRCIPIAKGT